MPPNLSYYYTQVLNNPSASPQAKEEARKYFASYQSPTGNLAPTETDPNPSQGTSGGVSGTGTVDQDQSKLFGMKVMDLLKQSQSLGTRLFEEQALNAQEAQAKRLSFNEPGLIGAAPSVQAGVRDASASALSPTISGAKASQQTFGEQLKTFGSTLDKAFGILQQEQDRQDKERDDARNLVNQALTTFGSKAVEIIDPKYWKLAGYDEKARQNVRDTLKEQELQLKVEKQKADELARAQIYGTGTTEELSNLAKAVQSGIININDVPAAQRAKVASELAAFGSSSSRQQSLQTSLDAVNSLLENPNRHKISGFLQGKFRLGNLLPSAQLALNQFNQLKGILSLESREKLRGTGTISDFEFKVLSQAATALDRNLNDAEFDAQLKVIKDVFAGKYASTQVGSSEKTVRVRRKSDGVTGTIPENEFDSNIYTKI